MKTKLIYILLSFSLLSACSSDEEFATVEQHSRNALELKVSAGDFVTYGDAPDTRATDSGATTTFDKDDRVGVIVLGENNTLLANNIPYIYNGTSWSFDSQTVSDEGSNKSQCYYDNQAQTYIVYYPYSADADGVTSIEGNNGLKSKFTPNEDQQSKADYRASDLMIWQSASGITPQKTLSVILSHAYNSVSIQLEAHCTLGDGQNTEITYLASLSDVNFIMGDKIGYAYPAPDGSYRYILPSDFTGTVRCFYSYVGKTYCKELTVSDATSAPASTSNTRYHFKQTIKLTYTLDNARIGDFYCVSTAADGTATGYLIPGDLPELTPEQQAACIGIVYSTDVSRIGAAATSVLSNNGVTTPHGLVMALTNASSDVCRWGYHGRDENNNGSDGTPFKDNTTTLKKQYNNVDGYGETHWIIDTYKNNSTTLKDAYIAFYHASRYGTTDSNTEKYAAPSNTTGWFIPSMGQWWDIVSNLGGIDLTDYRNSTENTADISDAAPIAVANINKYLENISGATTFSIGAHFWSSSECNENNAWYVDFSSTGSLLLNLIYKYFGDNRVRCSLAF